MSIEPSNKMAQIMTNNEHRLADKKILLYRTLNKLTLDNKSEHFLLYLEFILYIFIFSLESRSSLDSTYLVACYVICFFSVT